MAEITPNEDAMATLLSFSIDGRSKLPPFFKEPRQIPLENLLPKGSLTCVYQNLGRRKSFRSEKPLPSMSYIYRGVHQFSHSRSSKASIAALDRGKVNFPAFAYAEILHEIKDLTSRYCPLY